MDVSQQYDLLRLQTQAFEAINEMVRSASTDTVPLVGHLLPVVLERIAATMDPATAGAKDKPGDLQVFFQPLLSKAKHMLYVIGLLHRASCHINLKCCFSADPEALFVQSWLAMLLDSTKESFGFTFWVVFIAYTTRCWPILSGSSA